jgi:hypothetical protein
LVFGSEKGEFATLKIAAAKVAKTETSRSVLEAFVVENSSLVVDSRSTDFVVELFVIAEVVFD